MDKKPNPTDYTLKQWLSMHGTRTGHMTFNGVTYDDLTEVEWRQANNSWRSADPT